MAAARTCVTAADTVKTANVMEFCNTISHYHGIVVDKTCRDGTGKTALVTRAGLASQHTAS